MNFNPESFYRNYQLPPEPENVAKLIGRLREVMSGIIANHVITGPNPILFQVPPLNFGSFPVLYLGFIKTELPIPDEKIIVDILSLNDIPFRSKNGQLLTAPRVIDYMIDGARTMSRSIRVLSDRETLNLILQSEHTKGTSPQPGKFRIQRPHGSIELLYPVITKIV